MLKQITNQYSHKPPGFRRVNKQKFLENEILKISEEGEKQKQMSIRSFRMRFSGSQDLRLLYHPVLSATSAVLYTLQERCRNLHQKPFFSPETETPEARGHLHSLAPLVVTLTWLSPDSSFSDSWQLQPALAGPVSCTFPVSPSSARVAVAVFPEWETEHELPHPMMRSCLGLKADFFGRTLSQNMTVKVSDSGAKLPAFKSQLCPLYVTSGELLHFSWSRCLTFLTSVMGL